MSLSGQVVDLTKQRTQQERWSASANSHHISSTWPQGCGELALHEQANDDSSKNQCCVSCVVLCCHSNDGGQHCQEAKLPLHCGPQGFCEHHCWSQAKAQKRVHHTCHAVLTCLLCGLIRQQGQASVASPQGRWVPRSKSSSSLRPQGRWTITSGVQPKPGGVLTAGASAASIIPDTGGPIDTSHETTVPNARKSFT